jgi:hypothetical protein
MDSITAQKVVAITLEQLRREWPTDSPAHPGLDLFEARFKDNLRLVGVQRVPGPARGRKAKPADGKKD